MKSSTVVKRMDEVVDDFVSRTRFFHEPLSRGRAAMFVFQHRLNTRQRNSVLKLAVATNTPDWDLRLRIIGASAEEIIADHAHGGGKPHWQILEELGVRIGLSLERIRAYPALDSTRMCWLAWEALMKNRHWLEGLVANTCAERINVPGYGRGLMRERGWFGQERRRWGELFGLRDEELGFFSLHEAADIEHSNLGWNAVAQHAADLKMEEAVVEACRINLVVWEHYLNGIGAGGDRLSSAEIPG